MGQGGAVLRRGGLRLSCACVGPSEVLNAHALPLCAIQVLGAALPWISRRLLTDTTPELRSTLMALLYKVRVPCCMALGMAALCLWARRRLPMLCFNYRHHRVAALTLIAWRHSSGGHRGSACNTGPSQLASVR